MFHVMVVMTRVETDGDRPVVVKWAPGADGQRLRLEAERLERACHPGVVALVGSGASGDGWELRTRHGGRPLTTIGALTVAQVAGLMAGIASTLADLHDLGIVHGRLDGSHVLVGVEGRPVLCGFGDGTIPARPEDDVAGLGALLVSLLGTDEAGEPIPERRWRGHRAWAGWERRALLLLADQAAADPPTRRPTARRLAAAIADAVPGATRIADGSADQRETGEAGGNDPIERLRASAQVDAPAPRRAVRAMVLGVLGALLLAIGAPRLLRGDPPQEGVADAGPVEHAAETRVRTAVPLASSVLEAGGRRYRVGQDGDEVLVEDWDCDGEATPALLRPATGEVFVFPRWVDDGSLTVEPAVEVVGALALVSEQTGGACPTLAVRTASGELVPVVEAVR